MDNKSGFTKTVLNYLKTTHSSSCNAHLYCFQYSVHFYDRKLLYAELWRYMGVSCATICIRFAFKETITLFLGKDYVCTP